MLCRAAPSFIAAPPDASPKSPEIRAFQGMVITIASNGPPLNFQQE